MVNKKYTFLDNIVDLCEQSRLKSMRQLAKELVEKYNLDIKDSPTWAITVNSLAGCIRFRILRYLNDKKKEFVRERKPKKAASSKKVS